MAGLKLHFCGYQSDNSVHTKALHVLADAARKPLGGGIEIAITENVTAEGRWR